MTTTHVGVRIVEAGAAVVTVERGDGETLWVTGVERFPFNLSALVERCRAIPPDSYLVVDSEGLGTALWRVLGPPEGDEHRRLYAAMGRERQGLVDEMAVADQLNLVAFDEAIPPRERVALFAALEKYRRQVGDDGVIGHELAVALFLALLAPPPPYVAPEGWLVTDDEDDW